MIKRLNIIINNQSINKLLNNTLIINKIVFNNNSHSHSYIDRSFSNINFKFNHNHNHNHNHNVNKHHHIKFYSTINKNNNNKDNIYNNNNSNSDTKEKVESNNNNSNNNSSTDSNNNNNNSKEESESRDKDYYNSFKNDNANNEFKQKIENEKMKDKNFDARAIGMLIVKISLINYLIRYYVLDFTYCQGSSMQPTISSGAILLINRLTRDFQVNDLVTAISPTTGDYNICKRIKFVEGDTILFNSETGTVIYTIPKGYVWIEGDNPSTSKDSRSYGPVPKRLLTGKVILRLNPLSLLKDDPPESETQKLN